MKELFAPDFYVVPRDLSLHPDIEPFDEKVYAIAYWFEHLKDGKCVASNKTIALIASPHDPQPRSVQNSLTRLENCGFIKRVYKDGSKRHRLEIKTLVRFSMVRNGDDTKSQSETVMTLERNGDDSQSETVMTRVYKSKGVIEIRGGEAITPKDIAIKFFSSKEPDESLIEALVQKGVPMDIASREMTRFKSYWTEKNMSGTREKWQMEKTFEVRKRLATWFSRIKDFQSNKTNPKVAIIS